MKNKKVIIFGFILLLFFGLFSTYLTFKLINSDKLDTPKSIESDIDPENKFEMSNEAHSNESNNKKTDFETMGTITMPISKTNKNLDTNSEFNEIENIRSYYRNFDFKGASDYLSIVSTNFNITPNNKEIYKLYQESSLLLFLEDSIENQDYTTTHLLKTVKDPENQLLGTLMVPGLYREGIIRDSYSLNPDFEGVPIIYGKELIPEGSNDDVVNIINLRDSNKKSIYKFKLKLEEYDLFAYVVESEVETYVFKIEAAVEGTTHYMNFLEFKEMLKYKEDYDARRGNKSSISDAIKNSLKNEN